MLAPDARFVLRGSGGSRAWDGIDACRERFAYLLAAWPDTRMKRTDLFVAEDFYIAKNR